VKNCRFIPLKLAAVLVCSGLMLWGQSQIVDEVIAMIEAKLPEPVIVARIRQDGKKQEVPVADLVRLKKAGASEPIMLALLGTDTNGSAGSTGRTAESDASKSPFTEIGVYYKKSGDWMEVLPEVVNWKTGGVLKNIASGGVVKKDVNGHLPGENSRNSVLSPMEFTIYTPEGVAITEYQLIRLRAAPGKGYREFRTVTGGVFNTKSGAMRDMVPFEGKKVGNRLYSVVLPSTLGAGEYGFLHLGATGGSGGMQSLSMGKMYTFRLLE
jgi:hypothetical protein